MHLFTDEVMQALCWTLIHSLWQGLIAAVVAGIVIVLTKKSGSILRYNLLAALFLLFVVTACFTFAGQLHSTGTSNRTERVILSNAGQTGDVILSPVNSMYENNFTSRFVNYFNAHASLIVAIWFIILSAHFVKLLANAGYIQRVKHYKTHLPSEYWQSKIRELAHRLHIKKRVALLESEIIKVPMVAGFLKPVILFPFTFTSQLPQEQVEAILLHELAHIKRKDYFVNLLQSFAEILFFFNPGVLWISSLIRDERENCCDDMAIGETKNKKEFIHALVSFQEYNHLHTSKYGVAFPGRKNHLLNRVKRIITNNNKTLDNMEKFFLAGCFIVTGVLAVSFSTSSPDKIFKKIPGNPQPVTMSLKAFPVYQPALIPDTLPVPKEKGKEYISRDGNTTTFCKKGYKIVTTDNQVTALYIDGKKIPGYKMEGYQPVMQELMKEIKDDMDMQTRQLDKQEDILKGSQEELNKEIDQLKRIQEAITPGQLKALNENDRERFRQAEEKLEMTNEELQKLLGKIMLDAHSRPEDATQQAAILKLQKIQLNTVQCQLKLQLEKINKELLVISAQPVLNAANPAIYIRPVAPIVPVVPVKESKPIPSIIDDLINEKIIDSRDDLSFTLNSEVFEVNGIVQSPELHAKFKEKYLKGSARNHVIYSTRKGSTHSDIIINN